MHAAKLFAGRLRQLAIAHILQELDPPQPLVDRAQPFGRFGMLARLVIQEMPVGKDCQGLVCQSSVSNSIRSLRISRARSVPANWSGNKSTDRIR